MGSMPGATCARGEWRPGTALRRAFALLLLCTLAAPVSHAALYNSSTSATIRVVAGDVGAHSFSASLRATYSSGTHVGMVSWVVWDTAACNGTTPPSFEAGKDCYGNALDTTRFGAVDLVRPPRHAPHVPRVPHAARGAENAVDAGGGARWAGAAFANQLHAASVGHPPERHRRVRRACLLRRGAPHVTRDTGAGLTVMTLDDTPPSYLPGAPRVLAVGERGVSFLVGLNEPATLRYLLQSSVASPPSLDDVLSGSRRACGAARSLAAPGADAQHPLAQHPAAGAPGRRRDGDGVRAGGHPGRLRVCALPRSLGLRDACAQHKGARMCSAAGRHAFNSSPFVLVPCDRRGLR